MSAEFNKNEVIKAIRKIDADTHDSHHFGFTDEGRFSFSGNDEEKVISFTIQTCDWVNLISTMAHDYGRGITTDFDKIASAFARLIYLLKQMKNESK
jgi:hypothetical protein